MNVMMIGHSGAGKTTYLAAMYEIMTAGINDFSIEATSRSLHDRFLALVSDLRVGHYPAGTDVLSEYQMQLKFKHEHVLPFTWYDYRGGALTEANNPANEVETLINRIAAANALIIFFDGAKLMRNDFSVMKEYRRTQFCIQEAAKQLPSGVHLPISLVFTKGDLPDVDYERSPLYDNFGKIIEAIGENAQLHGMLTETIINRDQIMNVQFPFLFSMVYGLVRERDQAATMVNDHYELAKRYAGNANIFDDFASFFTDEDSWRQMSQREIQRAEEKYVLYQKLVNSTDRIIDMFNGAAEQQQLFLIQ